MVQFRLVIKMKCFYLLATVFSFMYELDFDSLYFCFVMDFRHLAIFAYCDCMGESVCVCNAVLIGRFKLLMV